MSFNENTRVKIPAILHLCRLGYTYLPLANAKRDLRTNIFTDIFEESIKRINKDSKDIDVNKTLEDITLALDNEDLGQAFYNMLITGTNPRIFDFNNLENNSFHVVTELPYKNSEEEFRPDITLLVNGMPLAFIEVKKPNNREGILAERDRINSRFKNKKFRKFINITQILVFSNNMEYDLESIEPVQGTFYASSSYHDVIFNCFREEEQFDLSKLLSPENDEVENTILSEHNLHVIKFSPEFITNKNPNNPINRTLTSLFKKDRFAMLLKYCIAYAKETNGLEKHIMRYPQFFATKAIEKKIDAGVKKGIIWHTQGSGKTALAYYNVKYLIDYFQKKEIIPKFYFIVDRIDLLNQAKREFSIRGLIVHTANSKDELLNDFRKRQPVHNFSGKPEITVVNIHKFKDDNDVVHSNDYDINVQRIYFLDEVHRSYNPTGSFLANLYNSDRNAILIGLTGTPLISQDRRSRDVFGEYIHKYYYNASIADGYTLRLIREGIETNYRIQLESILKEIEINKGEIERRIIYSHERFADPMLDYIIKDFLNSRIRFGDYSIGGMVVCDSADQAKILYKIFLKKYNPEQKTIDEISTDNLTVSEPIEEYGKFKKKENRSLKGSLILHNFGLIDDRKNEVEEFKVGNIDILFVYNMLLTGFDAKRLKKLYIGRVIKDHNLLQTLTRVNRPYKNFRYGYVVDFADIRKEFDETNRAYLDELQSQLGNEIQNYTNLFKSKEEIEEEIENIKETLFQFDLVNAEVFSQQINKIEDRQKVLEIKKALENAKNLYNLIRTLGHFDLLKKIDFHKLNHLYNETVRHLELLNLKESLQNNTETINMLNMALENIIFMFRKISEAEMIIADELKETLRKTRESLSRNFDKKDAEFISLYDELKRLFDKKNLDEISQEEMKENISLLLEIYEKITELNRKNDLLKTKYGNDEKYAILHKRILERKSICKKETDIHNALNEIKTQTDERVLMNKKMLDNDSYFINMLNPLIINGFKKVKIDLEPDSIRFINSHISKEYFDEYLGVRSW